MRVAMVAGSVDARLIPGQDAGPPSPAGTSFPQAARILNQPPRDLSVAHRNAASRHVRSSPFGAVPRGQPRNPHV